MNGTPDSLTGCGNWGSIATTSLPRRQCFNRGGSMGKCKEDDIAGSPDTGQAPQETPQAQEARRLIELITEVAGGELPNGERILVGPPDKKGGRYISVTHGTIADRTITSLGVFVEEEPVAEIVVEQMRDGRSHYFISLHFVARTTYTVGPVVTCTIDLPQNSVYYLTPVRASLPYSEKVAAAARERQALVKAGMPMEPFFLSSVDRYDYFGTVNALFAMVGRYQENPQSLQSDTSIALPLVPVGDA
jgi:hypothetical protein